MQQSWTPQLDFKSAASEIDAVRSRTKDKNHRQDDSFIWRYLRICKFDIDATVKRMQAYYTLRENNKNWFNWSPKNEELIDVFFKQHAFYIILPKKPNAPTVLVYKIGAFDPSQHTLESYVNFVTLVAETHLENAKFYSHDCHFFFDYQNVGMSYLPKLTPRFFWRCNNLQLSMPIDYKIIHVVNPNRHMSFFLNLSKYFMHSDLNEKLVNHETDHSSIHKFISPEYLPTEYGGTAGPEQLFVDENKALMTEGKDLFLQHSKFGLTKTKSF